MPKSIDQLRRDAKALRRAYEAGSPEAIARMTSLERRSDGAPFKHADFLHVIARENGFESWPSLAWASETVGLDRAAKQQRLKMALFHGQNWRVDQLLAETPDLAADHFGLQCALLQQAEVKAALVEDRSLATRDFGPRRPILHLAFSKVIHAHPEREADMLAIAEMLVKAGADVNDGFPVHPGSDHLLSALYGAIGHANNMVLARWLLEKGANPNDNESLYHATELGHHKGLKLLLAHGADPKGTNALLRAMDFDDLEAVKLLLGAGALADEFNDAEVGGELPFVIPALHQAARRMCGRKMVALLLDHGADVDRVFEEMTPYAFARVFGNAEMAAEMEHRGFDRPLTEMEAKLARIADGESLEGDFIDPEKLPKGARNIIRLILHLPGKLPHVRRLVEAGVEYDRPDYEGLTPVQAAGWEGLSEVMSYLIRQKPDLSHVNSYGGTLLSTIIHGSENCPFRRERDYLECLRIALEEGVALPKRAIELAGEPEVAAFLADWAEAHPGQVVEGGVG